MKRASGKKRKTTVMACAALLVFALTLLCPLFPPTAYAMSDFSQHKVNILLGGRAPIDTCLAISKTVRNADGSPLTGAQASRPFAFTVVFSDGGTYHYIIRNRETEGPAEPVAATPAPAESGPAEQPSVGEPGDGEALSPGEPAAPEDGAVPEPGETPDEPPAADDGESPSVSTDNAPAAPTEETGALPDDEAAVPTEEAIVSPEADPVSNAEQTEAPPDVGNPENAEAAANEIPTEGDLASGGVVYLTSGQIVTFPMMAQGVTYTVTEETPDGYVATGDGHSGTLTAFGALAAFVNTFGAETVIDGEKHWDLTGAPAGLNLPPYITIYLMDGDDIISSAPVRPDAAGRWTYSFSAPKYRENGDVIAYTVREADIPGFYSTVDGYDLTNHYIPDVLIAGRKTWVHGSNTNRPASIEILILADGVIVKRIPVTAVDSWSWSVTLPKLDPTGREIVYTVDETDIPNYTKQISGYDITNTYNGPGPTPTPTPTSPGPSPSPGPEETLTPPTVPAEPPGPEETVAPGETPPPEIIPTQTPPEANLPGDKPKTGDPFNLYLWICMLILSALGLSGLGLLSHRHKR